MMYYSYLDSPIGQLLIAGSETALEIIGFPGGKGRVEPKPEWQLKESMFGEVKQQLY